MSPGKAFLLAVFALLFFPPFSFSASFLQNSLNDVLYFVSNLLDFLLRPAPTSSAPLETIEEVPTPFPITAYPDGGLWGTLAAGDCSIADGGWARVDEYCRCLGYDGAGDPSLPMCYYEWTSDRYSWTDSSRYCPPMEGTHSGGGLALARVKCVKKTHNGIPTICGDGVCEAVTDDYSISPFLETRWNCPQDCSFCTGGCPYSSTCYDCSYCGDGACDFEYGETRNKCPADCVLQYCGNTVCETFTGENYATCPTDCP